MPAAVRKDFRTAHAPALFRELFGWQCHSPGLAKPARVIILINPAARHELDGSLKTILERTRS